MLGAAVATCRYRDVANSINQFTFYILHFSIYISFVFGLATQLCLSSMRRIGANGRLRSASPNSRRCVSFNARPYHPISLPRVRFATLG